MQDLLQGYKDTRKRLRSMYDDLREAAEGGDARAISDRQIISGMSGETEWIIEWLETGKRPGSKRGIERRAAYQREKLMDPIRMQAFLSKSTAGSPANLTESERFMLEEALQDLSVRERECYELSRGQGFSHEYIAEILQVTKGSVDSYIARAQEKISQRLTNSLFLVG